MVRVHAWSPHFINFWNQYVICQYGMWANESYPRYLHWESSTQRLAEIPRRLPLDLQYCFMCNTQRTLGPKLRFSHVWCQWALAPALAVSRLEGTSTEIHILCYVKIYVYIYIWTALPCLYIKQEIDMSATTMRSSMTHIFQWGRNGWPAQFPDCVTACFSSYTAFFSGWATHSYWLLCPSFH